jgi:hypothetical protein
MDGFVPQRKYGVRDIDVPVRTEAQKPYFTRYSWFDAASGFSLKIRNESNAAECDLGERAAFRAAPVSAQPDRQEGS